MHMYVTRKCNFLVFLVNFPFDFGLCLAFTSTHTTSNDLSMMYLRERRLELRLINICSYVGDRYVCCWCRHCRCCCWLSSVSKCRRTSIILVRGWFTILPLWLCRFVVWPVCAVWLCVAEPCTCTAHRATNDRKVRCDISVASCVYVSARATECFAKGNVNDERPGVNFPLSFSFSMIYRYCVYNNCSPSLVRARFCCTAEWISELPLRQRRKNETQNEDDRNWNALSVHRRRRRLHLSSTNARRQPKNESQNGEWKILFMFVRW